MSIKNIKWIPILGNCVENKGVLKYIGTPSTEGPNQGQSSACLARSNLDFENGSVKFRVKITHPDCKVQLGLNNGQTVEVYAGLNNGGAYGISSFTNGKWENFATAGMGNSPPINKNILVEVRLTGSDLHLFVDEVLVAKGTYLVRRSQLAFLIVGEGEAEIELLAVTNSDSVAFVVMQFTDEFDALYREVIAPTCAKFGFTAIRADDIYHNGLIVEDIARSIREATVVIADITPDNPNVYYEVGFSHGIGKSTILLADKKRSTLPFDVNGFRTIFYENTIGGKSAVEHSLRQHLESLVGRPSIDI